MSRDSRCSQRYRRRTCASSAYSNWCSLLKSTLGPVIQFTCGGSSSRVHIDLLLRFSCTLTFLRIAEWNTWMGCNIGPMRCEI